MIHKFLFIKSMLWLCKFYRTDFYRSMVETRKKPHVHSFKGRFKSSEIEQCKLYTYLSLPQWNSTPGVKLGLEAVNPQFQLQLSGVYYSCRVLNKTHPNLLL